MRRNMLVKYAITLAAFVCGGPSLALAQEVWSSAEGTMTLRLSREALELHGLWIDGPPAPGLLDDQVISVELLLDGSYDVKFAASDSGMIAFLSRDLRTIDGVTINTADVQLAVRDFTIGRTGDSLDVADGERLGEEIKPGSGSTYFELDAVKAGFDRFNETFKFASREVVISADLAAALGRPELAGVSVGRAEFAGPAIWVGGVAPQSAYEESLPGGGSGGRDGQRVPGPDMVFCQLYSLGQYGRAGDVVGLSVATTSWNIGDQPLPWYASPNEEHPFIVMDLFRLKTVDGSERFEQIGQSWIKHGFCALDSVQCGGGCQGTGCSTLGLGCTDTYGAGLNASQGGLGPRYEVDPWNREWSYAGSHFQTGGPSHDGASHRLQVHDADLDSAQNPGATYYSSSFYDTAEDIDQMNSAAWKPVTVSGSPGGSWSFGMSGAGTIPTWGHAIDAWTGATQTILAEEVPVVEFVSPDGRCVLAAKETDLGSGTWHYEYAVLNVDMDRQAGSFSIPIPPGTSVTNVGFHAVEHHDEAVNTTDPDAVSIDNAPWTSSVTGTEVTWSTTTNPLRWGTMYNFRFDADADPGDVTVTLGLFRSGAPSSVNGNTRGPSGPPAVCGDGVPEGNEECDPPDGVHCDAFCQWICGDGVVQAGEECDPPDGVTCDANCQIIYICGDGVTDPDEECDDAGESATCDGDCTFAVCGDGTINTTAGEVCDDGGESAACDDDCTLPLCGDGNINESAGEQCDDGGTVPGDGCDGSCQSESNDECASAVPICNGTVSGSTTGANSDGSASCGASASSPDVWYSYTPVTGGSLALTTCGAGNYDTVISVHTGDCPGTTSNQHACLDDGCPEPGYKTNLSTTVAAGVTYLIRLSGFSGASGDFELTVAGPDCGSSFPDCNNNGVDDAIDISSGTSQDCNSNGIPDECDVSSGTSQDCNGNGIPDECDLTSGTSQDCNSNGIPDECDISSETSQDCNGNGIPDECDITSGTSQDCNSNGMPDECETGGQSTYEASGLGIGIPDFDAGGIFHTINVADGGVISDLNLGLDITHTYVGDLCATLTHPNGTTAAAVIQRPGVSEPDPCHSGSPYGCSANNYAGIILDDAGTGGAIEAQCVADLASPPNYTPNNALSIFDGLNMAGNWTITVIDNAGGDVGTLNGWSLVITTTGGGVPPCGDPIRGGRMWDKWWAESGAAEPTGDHPLYPPAGQQFGSTTHRCKECHGWDYKGVDGAYGSGSHYTGIPGVFGSTMTPQEMFDIIKLDSGPNGHGFESHGLSDDDIWDLVQFLQDLAIDTDTYIDPAAQFLGDPLQGESSYINPPPSGGTACSICHGPDGTAINFGTPQNPKWVGTIAVGNPWEMLHKTRFGQPGAPMAAWLAYDGTDQGAADIGRYAQLYFPVDCIDSTNCDDGEFCNGDETCASGYCTAGSPPCPIELCDEGADTCADCAVDADCSDGLFCNGAETCDAGACLPGADPCPTQPCDEDNDICTGCADPAECDDGNACTDDACDAGTCVYTNNSNPCDDGDACTTNDACSNGACAGGVPPSCGGIGCTDCNGNGIRDDCEGLPDCNGDGIPDECQYADCNSNGINDVCDIAGGTSADCDGGPVGSIADGIALFGASCLGCHGAGGFGGWAPDIRDKPRTEIRDMMNPPTTHPMAHPEYTEQDLADLEAYLSTTGMSGGRPDLVPDDCQSLSDCDEDATSDGCELEAGTQVDADYDGIPDDCTCLGDPDCDDGNPCTDDTCDAGACVFSNNSNPCNDGDACTTSDTCSNGACAGGSPTDCDDGNACTNDACDSQAGCQHVDNSDPCDDGDACTTSDACANGACAGGSPTDCDDGNACTDDSCDSQAGCQHVDNNAPCDDGEFCNGQESCAGGQCVPGENPCPPTHVCDEANDVCTESTALMTCELSSMAALPGGSIDLDLFIENVPDLRGYQTTIEITQVSGEGSVDVPCPGGVYVDDTRPDHVFYGLAGDFSATDCENRRAAGAILQGSVDVGETPAYIATYALQVSSNATEGSTFEITITPDPDSFLRDSAGTPIPFLSGPPCTMTIVVCAPPTIQSEGSRYLGITPAPGSLPVALLVSGDEGDGAVSCVSAYVQADGRLDATPVFRLPTEWGTVHTTGEEVIPGAMYRVQADCGSPGSPDLSPASTAMTWLWADSDASDVVDMDDILCVLDGFSHVYLRCSFQMVNLTGCEPNNEIDIDDILAVLDAFGQAPYPCLTPCP